jgi:hypothetical protein
MPSFAPHSTGAGEDCTVEDLGHGPEDAQDLTQEFFARLLEKNYVATADREKRKFRSFLLLLGRLGPERLALVERRSRHHRIRA